MADDYASIVEQAYLNEVGRPSDAEGAAYWTGLLESGAITPADLSGLFSSTAEGVAFDQGAGTSGLAGLSVGGGGSGVSNEDFVRQTYLNETGRPGEAAGVQYWNDLLSSGAITRDQLSAAFSGTPEGAAFDAAAQAQAQGGGQTAGTTGTQTTVSGGIGTLGVGTTGQTATTAAPDVRSFLEGQYQAEFGRPFDAPGLDYWTDQIQKGNITKEQVAEIFSKSPEGLKYDIANLAAGKTTDVGFLPSDLLKRYSDLQAAYQTSVYRPGDVEGLKYWLANPTDYAKALGGSDEAFVQKAYRDTLKYAPDPEGLKYWMGQLAAGKVTREGLPTALANAAKQKAITTTVTQNKQVVDPRTGIVYSNASELAKAYNFGNFPLTSGTRTTDTGEVVPTVRLNLQQRPKVSLGIRGFAPLSLTNYEYDPSSVSLFGGNRLFGGTGMTGGKSVSLFGSPGATQAASTSAAKEGVVMAANGGMIMSDPVMRRAMFRVGGPVSSAGTGITSNVASPEENAKALQTMFAPSFRKGGEVQYFQEGGEAVDEELAAAQAAAEDEARFRQLPPERQAAEMSALERLRAQTRNPEPRFKPLMQVFRENRTLPIDREQEYTGRSMRGENPTRMRMVDGSISTMEGFMPPHMQDGSPPSAPRYSAAEIAQLRSQAVEDQKAENAMYRQAEEDEARYRAAVARDTAPSRTDGAVTREPVKDRLTLRLDKLQADREENKQKRRENQLLALMQAGFAAAAGRSRNALSNIAAGGVSGVQTLAELEKDRRAEDRALRREILETELTQERMREAAAERRAAREQTAAERERTMLQTVSSNINNRLGNIRSDILSARTKLTPGIPEDQKREIEIEIANLSAQAREEQDRLNQLYDRLGISKPRTAEQGSSGGFPVRVVSSSPTRK
jgi:hypothetical protein